MSQIMRTYRVWTGCGGWQRRTTTQAVWAATPHFKGLAVAVGCSAGVLVGWGIDRVAPHIERAVQSGIGQVWQAAPSAPPGAVNVPEPGGLMIFGAGLAVLALFRKK